MTDQRGIPSNECLDCGSNWQIVHVKFMDYEIVQWATASFCANCGAPMTTPTPIDHPDYVKRDGDEEPWMI